MEDNNINIDVLKKDKDFKNCLYKRLCNYHGLIDPIVDVKYKRGPWNTLDEMGIFNPYDMLDEFEKIILRVSKLPSRCREFIKDIMVSSYIDYKNFIQSKEDGSKEENRDKDTLNK